LKETQVKIETKLKKEISTEVYNNMASQFTKISEILEKTLEELENKHSKVEYNVGEFVKKFEEIDDINESVQMRLRECEGQSLKKSPSSILCSLSANTYVYERHEDEDKLERQENID